MRPTKENAAGPGRGEAAKDREVCPQFSPIGNLLSRLDRVNRESNVLHGNIRFGVQDVWDRLKGGWQ